MSKYEKRLEERNEVLEGEIENLSEQLQKAEKKLEKYEPQYTSEEVFKINVVLQEIGTASIVANNKPQPSSLQYYSGSYVVKNERAFRTMFYDDINIPLGISRPDGETLINNFFRQNGNPFKMKTPVPYCGQLINKISIGRTYGIYMTAEWIK